MDNYNVLKSLCFIAKIIQTFRKISRDSVIFFQNYSLNFYVVYLSTSFFCRIFDVFAGIYPSNTQRLKVCSALFCLSMLPQLACAGFAGKKRVPQFWLINDKTKVSAVSCIRIERRFVLQNHRFKEEYSKRSRPAQIKALNPPSKYK